MVGKKNRGFLQRWSNKKILDQKSNYSLPTSKREELGLTPDEKSESDSDNDRSFRNESEEVIQSSQESLEGLSDAEVLKKLKLPDPESMKAGDDFKAFLAKTVPEHIRKRALRKLWVSNPVLANLDGMNEYDDDFTLATSALEKFATNYVVGKGFRGQFNAEEAMDEGDLASGDLKSSSIRTSDLTEASAKDPKLEQDSKKGQPHELKLDELGESSSEIDEENPEVEKDLGQPVSDGVGPEISDEAESQAPPSRIKARKMIFTG